MGDQTYQQYQQQDDSAPVTRGEFRAGIRELRAEFKSNTNEMRAEFKEDMRELRSEFKEDMHKMEERIGRMISVLHAELRADMRVQSQILFGMCGVFIASLVTLFFMS